MSAETTNPGRQVCDQCWNGVYAYTGTCDHTPYRDQVFGYPVSCQYCGQQLPCQCSAWTEPEPAWTEPEPKTFTLSLTQHELETLEEALRRYAARVEIDLATDHHRHYSHTAWRPHLLEVERIQNYASDIILTAKERGDIQ